MQLKRSAVAALSAAALGMAGLATTAAPAQAAQDSPASTRAVYDLTFKYSAWTYWVPISQRAGILYAGKHGAYCYVSGLTFTDKGHTSSVWLKVDDDSGNEGVWVSRVYLDDSSYNAALPKCF
ncbi:hypothetical protein AB0C52_16585 [Streptomyces sp. NPDC048717]|uniref:hypothetical protein n=1 Tax=Streptomyces sp. NPDC048717 TaxID=3154928 RepID=UPI00343AC0EE